MTYNVRHVAAEDTGVYEWTQRRAGVLQLIADNAPNIFGVREASNRIIKDDLLQRVRHRL